MMEIQHKRDDGSFVATVNGMPYHVIPGDPYWDAAVAAGADAPMDQVVTESLASIRAGTSMDKAAFLNEVAERGILSDNDAVSGAKGEWPLAMSGFLALLTPKQKRDIQIVWAATDSVNRNDPFLMVFASWLLPSDETEATLDAIFGIEKI